MAVAIGFCFVWLFGLNVAFLSVSCGVGSWTCSRRAAGASICGVGGFACMIVCCLIWLLSGLLELGWVVVGCFTVVVLLWPFVWMWC